MFRRARKTARRRAALAAAGLGAFLLAAGSWGCGPAESGGEAALPAAAAGVRREPGLDVLLITVDTLRADALGSYGRERAGTPWLDRLAASGVRFDDAHAHNVLTLPSHANILS